MELGGGQGSWLIVSLLNRKISLLTKLGFKGLILVLFLGRFFVVCVLSFRNNGFEGAGGFDISLYLNIEKVTFSLNYESLALSFRKVSGFYCDSFNDVSILEA